MSTIPSAPRLQLNPVASNGALNFYWLAPVTDGGSRVSSYTLLCSSISYSTSINAASTYCQVSGLTNTQNYTFQLAANNAVGRSSYAPFIIAQPGNVPGGPRNFALSSLNTSTVNLVWSFSTNTNEGLNNYFVVKVEPQSSTISSYYQGIYQDQRSYQITDLPSSFYNFKIYSVNDAGWSIDNQFNVVSTVTGSVVLPSAPQSLSANTTASTAAISFTQDSGTYPTVNYSYSTDGTNYTLFSPAQNSSPVTITGLNVGQQYTVYLKAITAAGTSPASSSLTFIPSGQYRFSFNSGSVSGTSLANALGPAVTIDTVNTTIVTTPAVLIGLPAGATGCLYVIPTAVGQHYFDMPFVTGNNWSLTMWVKGVSTGRHMVIQGGPVRLELWDNNITCGMINGGSPVGPSYPTSFPSPYAYPYTAGQWTHVAMTFTGAFWSFYINGALYNSATLTSSPWLANPSQTISLGTPYPPAGDYFYDVRLVTQTYSAAQVQAIYNGTG